MIYITKEDIIAKAFERVIDESSKDFEIALDQSELEHISIIKSKLARYYDVKAIFDETNPIKNPVLTRILVFLVLWDIQQRNAYRKLSNVSKEQREWAEKELQNLSLGKIILEDLPPKPNSNGSNSKLLYGNLSNPDFYI